MPGFKFWFAHLLVVWPWVSHFASAPLSSLILKMWVMTVRTSEGLCEGELS